MSRFYCHSAGLLSAFCGTNATKMSTLCEYLLSIAPHRRSCTQTVAAAVAGLNAARLLGRCNVTVLEAKQNIGGRIHSEPQPGGWAFNHGAKIGYMEQEKLGSQRNPNLFRRPPNIVCDFFRLWVGHIHSLGTIGVRFWCDTVT